MLTEQEIPRYRKFTDSNISKSNLKSKYKHQYEEIYERYHDKLPVFFVEDIYKEKYVDLKKENNTENSEGE